MKYVKDIDELIKLKKLIRSEKCRLCNSIGYLVCHGYLYGTALKGCGRVVRGYRFMCSCRNKLKGCGRTFSVLLSQFIYRHTVTSGIMWGLIKVLSSGISKKQAWKKCAEAFSITTVYRLWNKFRLSQSRIRSLLSGKCDAPLKSRIEADEHTIHHLLLAFKDSICPVACFNEYFQCSFF